VSVPPIRLPHAVALVLTRLLLAFAALAAALPAAAWSIGGVRAPVVIGQPLDLTLPLQATGGEPLRRECVRVDASFGEQRLPRGQLSVAIEPAADPARALLRVRSAQAVEEPVVTLTVGLGCPARLTREFVLFAELPAFAAAPTGAEPQSAAVETHARADAAPGAASAAADSWPPQPAPADAQGAAALAAGPAATPPSASAAPSPVARPRAARAAARAESAPPRAAARAASGAATASQARLRLELLPPAAPALQAATARAEAAEQALLAVQAAAELARQRVSELEAALTRQSASTQAQHEAILAMQRDLAQLQAQTAWWPLLVGVLGAAALLATAAAWRARRSAALPWWSPAPAAVPLAPDAVAAAPPATARPPDAAVSAPGAPAPPPDRLAAGPAGLPAALSAAWPDRGRTEPRASAGPVLGPPPAESLPPPAPDEDLLAIADDEQIDLEQQVDFLCVLGQDDQAAALLRERLRLSAGRAPMPCLRLFELYRRLGDRAAYERLAERFAERFHALVPGWDEPEPDAPPLLAHPVLEDLQRCWADPPTARRRLAALLLRGQAAVAPWGLAAFDDLLLLYRIAGDRGDAPPAVAVTLELSPVEPVVSVAAAVRPRKPRRPAEAAAGRQREPRRDRELAPDFADAGPPD